MKPSELLKFLIASILGRLPVLLVGAPGVGKSDLVAQATQAAEADLIISHPAVADPTDAKGLPWVVDGHATFLPFGELARALETKKRTVWFLDDLGQAPAAVQASYMQLLLARRINGHVLSDEVTFIAATNRRTDRAGVSGILEPVKGRFVLQDFVTDLDEWCKWAIDANLPAEIIACLRFRPDLLSAFTATADLTNSPSPRGWQFVARIMALGLPLDLQHKAIIGAVGQGAATEFSAFLRLYRELPNIDQILIDPASVKVPDQPAVLYALASALALKATPTNFGRVAQFITRMMDAGRGEFAVLLIRDAMQRTPAVAQTTAFVKLATGDLGELISGK